MRIKKSSGMIFGADFTAAERKAVDMEVKRQLADHIRKCTMEIDALFLWTLHEELGFGPKRLKEFYDKFMPALNDMTNRYEMGQDDATWLCTYKLKEYGIDLEEWAKQYGL